MIEKTKSLVKSAKNAPRKKKIAVAIGVALVTAGVVSVVVNRKIEPLVEAAVSETP
jgi:Ethanolamine utilization protein EutJ (predicted chaperonin)